MKIHNSMSHQVEEFVPQNPPKVTMYTCGPTVYDHMHIGNLRTFVFSDLLLRVLKFNGYDVRSVQNITDIEDKIIKKALEENKTIDEVTDQYYKYFIRDVQDLNIPLKTEKDEPRATKYVTDYMIPYVQALIDKGFAYIEKDGSVYFDISKFSDYGKLSGVEKRELKTGTRVLSDEYTKEDVQDFALWKSVPESEFGFDSPWGRGRPGWHIECSVMSQETLGDTIDIHAGGVDLIFPHHENEIAQSEAKTGKKFVNYWVHGAHLLVDGAKMSKSLKNFYTLSDIKKRGFEPLALRYLFLQTHYRQEMNFTWEALQGAQNALDKLRNEFLSLGDGSVDEEFVSKFKEAVDDDLNMPKALALLWEEMKNNPSKNTILEADKIFGLGLASFKQKEVPEEVKKLLEEREKLRKEKRYHLADQLRAKIIKMGYKVEDKD